MRKIFLLCSLILSTVLAVAQPKANNSIIGIVLNAASKAPLEYATVTLFIKGDKNP